MDSSKVVKILDKSQVKLRKYLKNLLEESIGAFSFIPPRVLPIEDIYAYVYIKIEEMTLVRLSILWKNGLKVKENEK